MDFAKHLIHIRQSVDAATRTVGAVKSKASSADLPMSKELEVRLSDHLQRHDGKNVLLFVNRRGGPFSANKLLAKQPASLLDALKIARGEFPFTQPTRIMHSAKFLSTDIRQSSPTFRAGRGAAADQIRPPFT